MIWEVMVLVKLIEMNTLQCNVCKMHLSCKIIYVTLRLTVQSVSCLIHLNFTIAISMMAMQAVFNTDPGPYYATILGTVTYQYRVSRTRASAASQQHCEAS